MKWVAEAGLAMTDRPQKITFGEMRDMGVRGILVYCADYRCSHSIATSAARCPEPPRAGPLYGLRATSRRSPLPAMMVTASTLARAAVCRVANSSAP
jgi:hypothetical protein